MFHKYSKTFSRFLGRTGTKTLMDDLGELMRNGSDLKNLGGGNPAPIAEMQLIFRDSISRLLADGKF